MINDDVGDGDALDGGVEGRFLALGASDLFTTWHTIVSETIRSWHAALTEKELVTCQWVYYTMWDLHSGNSPMYDELVLRLLPIDREFFISEEKVVHKHSSPFSNEGEIHKTIAGLLSKGILLDTSEIWKFGANNSWKEENIRVLRFVREDLYEELVSASNENFIRVTNAYFLPKKKTRRGM